MRSFAVILAAVAALAATAQSYVIWQYFVKDDERVATQWSDSYRRSTCSQLLDAVGKIQRVSASADDMLAASAVARLEALSQYDERSEEELALEAAKTARSIFLSSVRYESDHLLRFVNSENIYFSESERAAMGYELFSNLPVELENYLSDIADTTIARDEAAFEALRAQLAEIGERYSSIKDICTPVLLGDTQ